MGSPHSYTVIPFYCIRTIALHHFDVDLSDEVFRIERATDYEAREDDCRGVTNEANEHPKATRADIADHRSP